MFVLPVAVLSTFQGTKARFSSFEILYEYMCRLCVEEFSLSLSSFALVLCADWADMVAGEVGRSPRVRASSPGEVFCQGLPKAISWADVARQFTPISVSVSVSFVTSLSLALRNLFT